MPYKDPARQLSYQTKWIAARREEWIAANGPCKWCGGAEDLQADHSDRVNRTTHRIWSWSAPRRKAALRKCIVLCRKCKEAKVAAENRSFDLGHGTDLMYAHGCRCQLCRDAHAGARRRQRDNKRAREAQEKRA